MPVPRAMSSIDQSQEPRKFTAHDLFRSYSDPPRTSFSSLHPVPAGPAARLVLETPWAHSTKPANDESAWLHGAWGSDLDPDEIFDMDMDFEHDLLEDDMQPELDPSYLDPKAEYLELDLTPSHSTLVTPKFSDQLPVPLSPIASITPLHTTQPLPGVAKEDVRFGDFRLEQEPEELEEEEEGEGNYGRMAQSWTSEASAASSYASSFCSWAASSCSDDDSYAQSAFSLASSLASLHIQTDLSSSFHPTHSHSQSPPRPIPRANRASSLASSLDSDGDKNEAAPELDLSSGLVKFALDTFSKHVSRHPGVDAFEGISPHTTTGGAFLSEGLFQQSGMEGQKEPRIGVSFPGSRRQEIYGGDL
ncbi:hypothetical protein IAR50_005856 [Cryptococcus sp. DSM 104548]